MSPTASLDRPASKRYALARYDDGRRALVVQRTDETTVQLTDVPLTAGRRPFLVEQLDLEKLARDLHLDPAAVPAAALEELRGIANAYVEHAEQLGRCPLAADWIGAAP